MGHEVAYIAFPCNLAPLYKPQHKQAPPKRGLLSLILRFRFIHEHLVPAWAAHARDKALAVVRAHVGQDVLRVSALVIDKEIRPRNLDL